MTDSTQELDEITHALDTYLQGLHNPSEDSLYSELRAMRDTENLKQAIAAYTNKQVEAVLGRLEQVHRANPLWVNMTQRVVPLSAIEAERNKLKESTND